MIHIIIILIKLFSELWGPVDTGDVIIKEGSAITIEVFYCS